MMALPLPAWISSPLGWPAFWLTLICVFKRVPRGPIRVKLPEGQWVLYEDAPYHHQQSRGQKSPPPHNARVQLRNSVRISENSHRRVGVDPKTGEFAVFDLTRCDPSGTMIFHGHRKTWEELTADMKTVLVRSGLADRKGKVRK